MKKQSLFVNKKIILVILYKRIGIYNKRYKLIINWIITEFYELIILIVYFIMRTEFKSFPMTLVHETWGKFVWVETNVNFYWLLNNCLNNAVIIW